MLDIAVIEEPAAAEASLDPIRSRILAALAEPGSATMLATRLGLPRQKVNYHLKELERHRLVELAEERRRGNVTERVYRATAASYVISPSALGAVSPDPDRSPDQLSAHWLLALGARLVQELGTLLAGAARARRRIATFGIGAEVRFASAADRAAFADELARTVADLVGRYHDESAPGGRTHRVIVGLHQIPVPAGTPGPSPHVPGAGYEPTEEHGPDAGHEPTGESAADAGQAPDTGPGPDARQERRP
ncbi:helix-turn-helix domain-containing protein [Streptomyces sp. NBC_01498]|uniref:ArsR/SmtB family transcription factor n=1 Tax=Streptomyces sp. NBC_01498 TaxID=2975870 RepID=UPI002E7BEE32|nr:helix-turn-helix domain-containing protein [Streptomyces sp. NBC_01498]WTL23175.1 helix-turn-helix domain-containing protein [Streptomyces sp. NBC_01498]